MISKWAKRFYQMAELVASWSKDPSTQVGAVITKQNRIVSVGFNGYPHGVSDSVDTDERELKYLKTLHAEENAILFSKRDLDGCDIWVTHFRAQTARQRSFKQVFRAFTAQNSLKTFYLAGEIKSK